MSPVSRPEATAPANPSISRPRGWCMSRPVWPLLWSNLGCSWDRSLRAAWFPMPTTCRSKDKNPFWSGKLLDPPGFQPRLSCPRSPASSCSILAMTVSTMTPPDYAAVIPPLLAAPDLIKVAQSLGVVTAWNMVADSNPQCIIQLAQRGSLPTP